MLRSLQEMRTFSVPRLCVVGFANTFLVESSKLAAFWQESSWYVLQLPAPADDFPFKDASQSSYSPPLSAF